MLILLLDMQQKSLLFKHVIAILHVKALPFGFYFHAVFPHLEDGDYLGMQWGGETDKGASNIHSANHCENEINYLYLFFSPLKQGF